ncbi:hypothetical protein BWP39_27615 [Paraburkholderia acidicola]|uniref:PAAR motif-containing protein n=1 Tax=Paraburkholderia acidicola TaxID=1912599 RepID=A0A2A4ESR0_9BURK|nr:PAAR domain-containing protein [Paraburkholderia acidicola]PCE23450.1 hypothetical protein BWP39_27615 [Paraburkholderia acidicola]
MDRLVVKGDRTSTGGWVIGASSMMFDGSKQVATKGDHATCGKCKGSFPIHGTANTWLDGGTPMVKDRDRVLCPCGHNCVLASSATTSFIGDRAGSAQSGTSMWERKQGRDEQGYDEQIRTVAPGATVEGYPYFIETPDGQTFFGQLDSGGLLPRIFTEGTDEFSIYWGDEALAKQDGA